MNRLVVRRQAGFSLIELVIVVVIIGIIAAIAIPRISRGSTNAIESSLTANLAVLRSAIDIYAAEHGGTFPTLADFVAQMTGYTDATGAHNGADGSTPGTKDVATGKIYGPYLRKMPPLPVGATKGSTGVAAAAGAGVGWVYSAVDGNITAGTTTETDSSGRLYTSY